jgi:predicted dehydrogenase
MYSTAIIGAGSIGALKPDKYDFIGGKNILTHAHACYDHDGIGPVIVMDADKEKARKAGEKWGFLYTDSLSEIVKIDPQIVILAVPTELHLETMQKIIHADIRPKVVIAEKPFANSVDEAKEMRKLSTIYGFTYIIDYIRRFDPIHRSIGLSLNSGEFGKIYNCRVTYTRGLKHEACHGVDLCGFFFGNYISGIPINDLGSIHERENDPSHVAILKFEKCQNVQFWPINGEKYSIFDIDIYAEKARIIFKDHGRYAHVHEVHKEPVYGDYNALKPNPDIYETKLVIALYYLIRNAIRVIEGKAEPHCGYHDALKVHNIYEDLRI